MITQALLKKMLSYDPSTGVFTWKARPTIRKEWNTRYAGTKAGTLRPDGRIQIKLAERLHLSSRLAWLYVTGGWPADEIDHKNRIRSDDRFENLREATRGQNGANRGKWRGTAKYLGVHRKRKKWESQICRDGVSYRLGVYQTQEAAALAYNKAAKRLFGEFANLNTVGQ